VFFRNSRCLACESPLGYEPISGEIQALEAGSTEGLYRLAGSSGEKEYRRCSNLELASGCNWLVEASDENTLCKSCRLDRTIPDLAVADNVECYRRISVAKRRLVSMLIGLRLPVASKVSEDPENGLAFDLLRSPEGGPAVMTGHANGIITLNIEEAEDETRERIRVAMREQYRTVLGHLRHETGHYYWDRLIAGSVWIDEYRALFGDEREDYSAALDRYYNQGPAVSWQQNFVSAYASAHPWEDWSETWAHYLHMMDTFDTALSFGLDPEASIDMQVEPFTSESLSDPNDADSAQFLHFINSWTQLSAVLNELSRGMGLADFYPFVLSRPVVTKLHFLHRVVTAAGKEQESA